jgi:hypothetical protein
LICQDRLDRVEELDPARIQLVDELIQLRRQIEDDLVVRKLGQLGLLACENVDHRLVRPTVERVEQPAELLALENLQGDAVHVALHLRHDGLHDRLCLRGQQVRDLVLHSVRREQLVGRLGRQVVDDYLVPRQRRHGGDVLVGVGHRGDRPRRDHRDRDEQ